MKMIITSVFAILASYTSLARGVVVPRSNACTTVHTGYLSANATGTFRSFTLNGSKELTYTGNGQKPLKVEFQSCPEISNGPGFPDQDIYGGRLLAVSAGSNQCVAITNQGAATGPYYTVVKTCDSNVSPGYPFAWSYRGDLQGAIYWEGFSDEEGTIHQGGCGNLGYASHSKGVPTLSGNQISVVCKGTPFRLSSKAD